MVSRLRFPDDRTVFVYQQPGQPILTPPRTGFIVFLDQAGTQLADIQTPAGNPIEFSTVYTGTDSGTATEDVDRTVELDVLGHVVVDEREIFVPDVLDVLERPRIEVVYADDTMSFCQ